MVRRIKVGDVEARIGQKKEGCVESKRRQFTRSRGQKDKTGERLGDADLKGPVWVEFSVDIIIRVLLVIYFVELNWKLNWI